VYVNGSLLLLAADREANHEVSSAEEARKSERPASGEW
jgi:hypothetical protein